MQQSEMIQNERLVDGFVDTGRDMFMLALPLTAVVEASETWGPRGHECAVTLWIAGQAITVELRSEHFRLVQRMLANRVPIQDPRTKARGQ